LNVLHLTNYFLPESSGTTTRLYNIVRRLTYSVQILTSNRYVKGEVIKEKEGQYGNVAVRRLPLTFGSPGSSPLSIIGAIRQDKKILIEAAANYQYDIIHAHNAVVFGQAGAEISAKTAKPLVFEYHGLAHDSVSGLLKGLKSWYIRNTDRQVMQKAAHTVTLTQKLKEWLCLNYGIPERKITVVPNGADTERFTPKKEYALKAAELKNKLAIKGKTLMYAGVMDRINGIDTLAAMVPAILKEKPEVCFIFLGGPGMSESLKTLCAAYPKNVRFLSSVPYDEMPSYYELCDVFVIPRPSTVSSETIVPLKLLEVMAMGKPVVASDVGGLAEVIKHGENGYLYHKDDTASLKNALLEALAADNTQIGLEARQTVLDSYTWEKSVERLSAVYQQLTGKG
jgi:glycosyltransferase involved in cell wall biosynthesis